LFIGGFTNANYVAVEDSKPETSEARNLLADISQQAQALASMHITLILVNTWVIHCCFQLILKQAMLPLIHSGMILYSLLRSTINSSVSLGGLLVTRN
jgi:hypothetical protein